MSNGDPTAADGLRSIPTTWVWIAVFVVVALIGYGQTPWDTLAMLLEEKGVGEKGQQMIGFVASYTLPLTAGLFVLAYLGLIGAYRGASVIAGWLVAGGVLIGSAMLAGAVGLGQLPDFATAIPQSGPWFARPVAWVLQAYVNAYGWPLAVSSAAIAAGAAIQLERLNHGEPTAANPD